MGEQNYGYALIKKGGWCGAIPPENLLTDAVDGAAACASLAQGAGGQTFILGIGFARGKCYKGTLPVDDALWDKWEGERATPECAEKDGWLSSALFDFYAIKPIEEVVLEK